MSHTRAELKRCTPAELARRGQALARPRPLPPDDLAGVRLMAEILLEKGEPLLAYEVITLLPDESRADPRVRQCLGLALARTGAAEEARAILDALCAEQLARGLPAADDEAATVALEETLALLGRTYKDMGLPRHPGEPIADPGQLQKAYELYSTAYMLRMHYYPGINVAFLCALLGRWTMARHVAAEVREKCQAILDATPGQPGPYWIDATRGEAAIILGLEDEAREAYGAAGKACRAEGLYGSLASMARQLRFLLAALGRQPAEASQYLAMPRVAVFAGHMVDMPERPAPRFPEGIADLVRAEIVDWLKHEDVEIGYCSAACGSDLLFIDALLERGGKAHVYLPFSADKFLETSVDIAPSKRWRTLFNAIKDRVVIETISNHPLTFGAVAYDFANQILHGAAIRRAEELGTDLRRLVVWDGKDGDGPSGTRDVIGQWLRASHSIDVIRVPEVSPAAPLGDLGSLPPMGRPIEGLNTTAQLRTQVAALLFADVKGFSKLTEEQIPVFVDKFLGAVARLLERDEFRTEKRNTWGDGLYIAFETVHAAGRFALDLAEIVKATDWAALGLPAHLALRTALHAGPVYLCTDPVTKQPNCIGTNVSHAARLEPKTPPNQVYASAQFAALSAALGIREFSCRYIGHVDWAKDYGIFPTYHVLG